MRMGVSNRVVARNNLGRFISEIESGGEQAVRDAIEQGAALSRDLAPVGVKPDKRTVPLASSIETVMSSRTSGYWRSFARHALPIEFGARPHPLPGNVRFFWMEEGRWWKPGTNTINHPGNQAQPFLRPAYEAVMGRVMENVKRRYPGRA